MTIPGAPLIVGAGPAQLQQGRPTNYHANAVNTAVGSTIDDPVATATNPENFPQVVNIQAIQGAPAGSASWYQPNLDGAAPA